MHQHLNITVKGKVQGVFFRASTAAEAKRLGVTGFVSNQADGTVFLEAEGDKESLAQLTKWCRKGPAQARVDEIIVTDGDFRNYTVFEIRR